MHSQAGQPNVDLLLLSGNFPFHRTEVANPGQFTAHLRRMLLSQECHLFKKTTSHSLGIALDLLIESATTFH